MNSYLFPGQGSQMKGMGRDLFIKYGDYIKEADEILGYSVADLCLNNPNGNLSKTQYTQPAVYIVDALSYLDVQTKLGKPDFMAGHSLGEFAALFASGAFSFETGLRLVQRRGTLMAEIDGGGMAAVVGLTESQVQDVLNENGLDAIDIANMNCPTQIVISGRRSDIQKAQKHFVEAGCKGYFDLPVSGAFHSRYMETPKKKFEYFIADFEFMPLSIPVVSNVTARLYEYPHIRQLLSNQIVSSVKWYESIRFIRSQGNIQFKEIGPGNLLTNMLAKIE